MGAAGSSLLSAAIDLSVNVVVSGLLEGLFPGVDTKESVWWGAVLAFAEIGIHVAVSSTLVLYSYETFSIDGKMVPYGALTGVFLMTQAVQRMQRLVQYLRAGMQSRAEMRIHAGDAQEAADEDSEMEGQ